MIITPQDLLCDKHTCVLDTSRVMMACVCAMHVCIAFVHTLHEPNLGGYVSNTQVCVCVCVPAGEVGQEGLVEGASSRTPGLLYSFTHQRRTSGLEGDCSCSKAPEVSKSNW